jgi:catechol 2,3-dioxygenase-like lactoylglutathione lyase family enzyme
MANTFGTDILIQAPDPQKAARFYVEQLGFEITDPNPKMIGLHGQAHQFVHRARSDIWAGSGSGRG